MRAVELLPFVPVMWMTGYDDWGLPSRSVSAAIRARVGSIPFSGQRASRSAQSSRKGSGILRHSGESRLWHEPPYCAHGAGPGPRGGSAMTSDTAPPVDVCASSPGSRTATSPTTPSTSSSRPTSTPRSAGCPRPSTEVLGLAAGRDRRTQRRGPRPPRRHAEIGALAQALNERPIRVRTARCRMLTKAGPYKPMQLRGRPALDRRRDRRRPHHHHAGHQRARRRTARPVGAERGQPGPRPRGRRGRACCSRCARRSSPPAAYPLAWYGAPGGRRGQDGREPRVRRAEPRLRRPDRGLLGRRAAGPADPPASPSARAPRRCATASPTTPSSRRGAMPPRPRP